MCDLDESPGPIFIEGHDNFVFGKNISAKAEISKTWATKKIEELSDARLNKEQLLLTLALDF